MLKIAQARYERSSKTWTLNVCVTAQLSCSRAGEYSPFQLACTVVKNLALKAEMPHPRHGNSPQSKHMSIRTLGCPLGATKVLSDVSDTAPSLSALRKFLPISMTWRPTAATVVILPTSMTWRPGLNVCRVPSYRVRSGARSGGQIVCWLPVGRDRVSDRVP